MALAVTAHADSYDGLLKRYAKQIRQQDKQLQTLRANLRMKEQEAKAWQGKAEQAKTQWSQAQIESDRVRVAVQSVRVQRRQSQTLAEAAEWSAVERSLLASAADRQTAYWTRELYERRLGTGGAAPLTIADRSPEYVLGRLCDVSVTSHQQANRAKSDEVALRIKEMRLQNQEQTQTQALNRLHENQQSLWLRWQVALRRQAALEEERNEVEQSEQALKVMVQELRDHRNQTLAARDAHGVSDQALASLKGTLPWPATGRVSQGFGRQYSRDLQQLLISNGIRIETGPGHPVRTVESGKVLFASAFKQYGQMVIVQHADGLTSVYGDLGDILVKEGDQLGPLQSVGTVAAAGSFYFELRRDEEPINPLAYLAPNHSDISLRRNFP